MINTTDSQNKKYKLLTPTSIRRSRRSKRRVLGAFSPQPKVAMPLSVMSQQKVCINYLFWMISYHQFIQSSIKEFWDVAIHQKFLGGKQQFHYYNLNILWT